VNIAPDPRLGQGAALLYTDFASGTATALDASALTIATNTVRWHTHLTTITNTSVIPFFTAGTVYLIEVGITQQTQIYALDAATGVVRWQHSYADHFDTLVAEPFA